MDPSHDHTPGRRRNALLAVLRRDVVVRRAAIAGLCWVLAYAVLTRLSSDSVAMTRFVGNVVYLGPVIAAALAATVAARRRWARSRTGLAWTFFAVSANLWLVGELIWTGYAYLTGNDPPYPSAADWFYLAGYLAMIPGFVLAFGQGHRSQRTRVGLDLALVALALGALGWHTLVAPQLADTGGIARVVIALYPISDIAMVVCLLTLGLSGHRRLPASVQLVGWSYLAAACVDVCSMHQSVHGAAYSDTGWLNTGYQVTNVLLALAGLIAARHREPDAVRLELGRDLTIVPLMVAGTATAYFVGRAYLRAGGGIGILLVGMVVVAGLMVRQYLVTRDRTRLAAELAHSLAEQERLAATDALTGLHNRRYFETAFDSEIHRARRSGRPLSLVVLDLDHFKRINDERGHPAGDAALIQAAARLRAATRGGDVVARYGGEEFVWLLPDTDETGAAILAERLRTTLNSQSIVMPEGSPISITGSLGVASAPGLTAGPELVRDADQAMYRAKTTGRDRVVLASEMRAELAVELAPVAVELPVATA